MPSVPSHALDALTQGVLTGEVRAIARAITLAESRDPTRLELLERLFPHTGRAFKVGITGAPGAGKSTLTYQLIPRLKAKGYRVGVLAVDPTSPFSGGAILGDRIRFDDALEGVYIRSLASRGSVGGLSRGVPPAIRVLEAAGYDLVLIETVGAGQLQVDVRFVADTVVLTLVPEAGDVIQAMKAGIIEIADIYVINKADREGATRMRLDLRNALELGGKPKGLEPADYPHRSHLRQGRRRTGRVYRGTQAVPAAIGGLGDATPATTGVGTAITDSGHAGTAGARDHTATVQHRDAARCAAG
jgi:LAO/AO transport system kinase